MHLDMQTSHPSALQSSRWLVVLCLLFTVIGRSAENSQSVVDRLAKVGLFAFGGVGFANVTSPGEKDYRLLLSSPSAEADFERLFASGNPQAKCYALVGIHQLNPEKFNTLSAPLHSSKEKVSTMHGCIMSHQTMADLIGRIGAGGYSK